MKLRRLIGIISTIEISVLLLSFHATFSKIVENESTVNTTGFTKIVGGKYAKAEQFPWVAAVLRLINNEIFMSCGGSIISERWVLTAAHCTFNYPRQFLVVLGETNKKYIRGSLYQGQGDAMIMSTVVTHPQYRLTNNDIALIYMPRDITFGDRIRPIRLPGEIYQEETFDGKKALVFGWGSTGQTGSPILKWGELPIISNDQCRQYWRVNMSHICTAVGVGTDACQGDSGGPLVIGTSSGPILIGIVSFGDEYYPSSKPSVFTRVTSFIRWIQKVTNLRF